LLGETFLLYDNGPANEDSDVESAEEEEDSGRVLVFSTRRNIELLCNSSTWFLDGTFKTVPGIFAQIFTILGIRKRNIDQGEGVPLPLVYALLSRKTTEQYEIVLSAVKNAVRDFNVQACVPTKLMCDFELAIINACKKVYSGVPPSACFFHLGQSVYGRVQTEGLQVQYSDPDDRTIKDFIHAMLTLVFVPKCDVLRTFDQLKATCPAPALPVMQYFERTYVRGRPGRGRRPAIAPRYHPDLWNHFESARNKSHRTNNASVGWHNRFRIVLGKHHPDLYSALGEFQKVQGYIEVCIAELALGKRVKVAPKRKWVELQERIQGIAEQYDTYKANNDIINYLHTLGNNIVLT